MTDQIPVLDVSDLSGAAQRQRVAAELGAAARGVGFVQVVGHGIALATFEAVYDAAEALWARSDTELDTLSSPTGHPFRGVVYGVDANGDRTFQRLQNCRITSPEEAAGLGYTDPYLDFFSGNLRPELPVLNAAIDQCSAAAWSLGAALLGLFALDLGLGEDGLDQYFTRHVSYFAVQDYPATELDAPDGIRISEHSDSGALTMLHQRGDYEGLQVRTKAGEHVIVPVMDQGIVVNTGDLMARWTNDEFAATPHRVLDGPAGLGRASIAMHYLPNADARIEPIQHLVGDGQDRYEPVTMYDWDRRYFQKRSLVLSLADELPDAGEPAEWVGLNG